MTNNRKAAAWRTLAVILTLLQAACATTELTEFRTVDIRVDVEDTSAHLDGLPLRSGQVIIREAGTSMGFLMNLMAEDYAPFGHAGIVVVEKNGAFVYDAFGLLNSRFWQPPTRRLRGRIRRLPLTTFLKRGTVSAIYEHHDVDLDIVASYALEAHKSRLAFDGLFDYRTPDQVYCSEFVAAALLAAGHDNIEPTPRTDNASLNRVMAWLDLDAPGFILSARLLDNATEVARISERYSMAQIHAHFAYERELHRRFTADQKLGNIFRWTYAGPRIRPHLIELHKQLLDGADAASDPATWATQQISSTLTQSAIQVSNN